MHPAILLLALQASSCEPALDLQREIQTATSVEVRAATDFDRNIAPLQDLRSKHPDDLFVNERYQDGVDRHGIEGHVKAMIQEYQDRAMQAPDDVASQYLFARSLIGRNTPAAIQTLIQIATDHPTFAPAHRTLAAIYATHTFRDEQAGRVERARWRKLCPGSGSGATAMVTAWTHILPSPSPRMDEAERLLADGGDLERVEAMAMQSIQDDEWRLQRMRPFDWYRVEDKREAQRALLTNYWRLWSLQVRCHRKAGRQDRARDVLAQMERRVGALARSRDPESAYWNALATLARLHAEGGQVELAGQKVALLQELLTQQPNADRAAQLSTLQQEIDLLRCAACVHR